MVFLSFDDAWVEAWKAALPLFASLDILATFYVSLRDPSGAALPPAFWESLATIEAAGHTIGYHTVSHYNAPARVRDVGLARWVTEDIDAGLEEFAAHGITPRHFAYPYGKHDEVTDEALLERFDTLRVARLEGETYATYTYADLGECRIFDAPDIADPKTCANVERAISEGRSIFLHGHHPNHPSGRVEEIAATVKRLGARFATMKELDR